MIDVAEHDLKTILTLLDRHVPECEVRAFGSRVSWTAKDHSDLDLVLVGPAKLERGKLEELKEAFEESSLPFTVDIMDWHKISPEFQKNIEKAFTVVKKPASQKNNGWQYYKVSDFAEVIGGGTPKTEVQEYWNGDIPWITPKDLASHQARRIARGERNITQEGLKNSSARVVPTDTVLLTSRAPVGYLAIAQNEVSTNQGFRNLVVKEGFSPEFVYYLLLNNVDYLKRHATGSTFQELSGGTLKNLEFQIPEYTTQKQIAKILGDLDEKIELNHQMNKTLEAIAQAVFKKWFVDFEFPGYEKTKFVNGLPEGWREAPLTDIADVLGGGTPSTTESSFWGSEIPFFTPKDVGDGCYVIEAEKHVTKKGLDNCNSKLYARNTVFITARGTVGKVCMAGCEMAMNQSCYAILSKGGMKNQLFMYLLIKSLAVELTQNSHGTVFETITTETFRKTQILVPPPQIVSEFNDQVALFYDLILTNMLENKCLVKYRDSLLPKLMAGEVAVAEVPNERDQCRDHS